MVSSVGHSSADLSAGEPSVAYFTCISELFIPVFSCRHYVFIQHIFAEFLLCLSDCSNYFG